MRTGLWIVLLATSLAFAGDWAQWRGPHFNGTSDETGLVDSLTPETLLWKQPLPGISAATPVIASGKVYLVSTHQDSDDLLALCLNAISGKPIWQKTLAQSGRKLGQGNTQASCSPCADASGAVFLFGEGTLVKLSPAGKALWRRNLIDDYGALSVKFGYSSSPLLADGRLYVSVLRYPKDNGVDGLDSYLLCVDAENGQTIFKQNRDTDAKDESTNAYTTPVLTTVGDQQQIVIYGGDYLTGHDPASGNELWRHLYTEPRMPMDRLIPTPAVADGRLFCSYPRGGKTFAVDLNKAASDASPTLWTHDTPGTDISCPLLYDGSLYIINEKKKTLSCLDPETGQARWTGQLDKSGMYYSSPTGADGKLYLVNRAGVVTVVAADAKAFRILSTHDFDGKPTDSTLAIADGRLYLRTATTLYCFGTQ